MDDAESHRDLRSLLAAASAGDGTAWNAIVDRFSSLLWSVARAHRLNFDDSSDVVQNTWLRLLDHLDQIEQPEALPGWLATVARREAYSILRLQGKVRTVRDDDLAGTLVDDNVGELDSALLERERDVQLWEAFGTLTEQCRRLLRVLMATDRPNYTSVSESLGMPVGSIGPTRMRCLKSLRTALESKNDDDHAQAASTPSTVGAPDRSRTPGPMRPRRKGAQS